MAHRGRCGREEPPCSAGSGWEGAESSSRLRIYDGFMDESPSERSEQGMGYVLHLIERVLSTRCYKLSRDERSESRDGSAYYYKVF